MTVLDRVVYVYSQSVPPRQQQVQHKLESFETETYDAAMKTLVFRQLTTVPLIYDIRYPGAMVGCKTAHRLFLSDYVAQSTIVRRINPVDGQTELSWTVGSYRRLSSDGNGHLLLAGKNELQKFDTQGHCMQKVTLGSVCNFRQQRALPLPDNAYLIVCNDGPDKDSLRKVTANGRSSCAHAGRHWYTIGFTVDSHGCVLLLEFSYDTGVTRLRQLNFGATGGTKTCLLMTRNTMPHTVFQWTDMWIDEERGLLFAWTHIFNCLSVFLVKDV